MGRLTTAPVPFSLDQRAVSCEGRHMDSSVIKAVGFVHLDMHSILSLRAE
jgi:hypothetical protein